MPIPVVILPDTSFGMKLIKTSTNQIQFLSGAIGLSIQQHCEENTDLYNMMIGGIRYVTWSTYNVGLSIRVKGMSSPNIHVRPLGFHNHKKTNGI